MYPDETQMFCKRLMISIKKVMYSILRDEVVNAIYSLKHGKAACLENIPVELITYAGEEMIDILHVRIYVKLVSSQIKSLIITLPKKDNLQHCSYYRTIKLIKV